LRHGIVAPFVRDGAEQPVPLRYLRDVVAGQRERERGAGQLEGLVTPSVLRGQERLEAKAARLEIIPPGAHRLLVRTFDNPQRLFTILAEQALCRQEPLGGGVRIAVAPRERLGSFKPCRQCPGAGALQLVDRRQSPLRLTDPREVAEYRVGKLLPCTDGLGQFSAQLGATPELLEHRQAARLVGPFRPKLQRRAPRGCRIPVRMQRAVPPRRLDQQRAGALPLPCRQPVLGDEPGLRASSVEQLRQ
jgi:hypothetical protein